MSKLNMGSQSMSGDSEGFGDYRYQKALKEISKLINVNREIKMESERHRQASEELESRLEEALQHNATLQNNLHLLSNEYQNLSRQYQKLSQEYVVLEEYCKKAEYEQRQYMQSSEMESKVKTELHQKHLEEIEQISGRFHSQVNQLAQELRKKQELIDHLETKLGDFNQVQYLLMQARQKQAKILKENQETKQENQQLSLKIHELIQEISNLQQRLTCKKPDQELTNKLKINEEWIKSLNQQNYNLKQKLLEEEYKKQRQKCNQTIFHQLVRHNSSILPTSNPANQLLMKECIKQLQKKIKKYEEDKTKIAEKLHKFKSANKDLEIKNITLEKQVNLLLKKVKGFEELTERQQREIELMIEEYHKEMHKMLIRSNFNNSHAGNGFQGIRESEDQKEKQRKITTEDSMVNCLENGRRAKEEQLEERIKGLSEEFSRIENEFDVQRKENESLKEKQSKLIRQLSEIRQEQSNKSSLIKYLQQKIASLKEERTEIIKAYNDLETQVFSEKGKITKPSRDNSPQKQLFSYQQHQNNHHNQSQGHQRPSISHNVNKTPSQKGSDSPSKTHIHISTLEIDPQSSGTLLKAQSINKSNNKIFVINGKKYEAVVLKNTSNNGHPHGHNLQHSSHSNNGNGSHRTVRPSIHSPQKHEHMVNAQRA